MSEVLPNLLDVIVALKRGLTASATGKGWDNAEYHRLRKIVLSASPLAPIAPELLRRCHTLDDFWEYIQPKFAHYAERRAYLEEQFKPLFDRADVPIQDSGLALEVGELIGRGGFGEVYRVRHRLLGIDFAVKLFAPVYGDINDGHMERFFREARILFSLNHPNIIRVHDVGVYNHRPYIQMDLFEGSNLNQVLSRSGRITPLSALKIVTAIAEGLRHAHEDVHVIHRDLKPSNVMIAKPGRLRILDFGLGVFVEEDIVSRVTKTGESVVGGYYTAPELLENAHLLAPNVDIYSLGGIWFTLLCGRAPAGADIDQALDREVTLTPQYRRTLLRCLSSADLRYKAAGELLQDLARLGAA
jgi:serine/threonine protein kinase